MDAHFVYIVECADGTLYTGYTTDVDARINSHNQGTGAKYTRGRAPVTLVHLERHGSKSSAMKREATIKSMDRNEKFTVIESSSNEDQSSIDP